MNGRWRAIASITSNLSVIIFIFVHCLLNFFYQVSVYRAAISGGDSFLIVFSAVLWTIALNFVCLPGIGRSCTRAHDFFVLAGTTQPLFSLSFCDAALLFCLPE